MSCPSGERGRAPSGFCAGWQPEDSARRRPDVCPGCLRELSEPEDIDKMSRALLECGTGEEFIERVRAA